MQMEIQKKNALTSTILDEKQQVMQTIPEVS